MKFKRAFAISIFFHALPVLMALFFTDYFSKEKPFQIFLKKGANSSQIEIISFKFTGDGQNKQNKSPSTLEGVKADEINKILNRIKYPPVALENGWEADCEWLVQIGKDSLAVKIEPVVNCKYQIFEKEFSKAIYDWKFNLPENTLLKIPVKFRIHRD